MDTVVTPQRRLDFDTHDESLENFNSVHFEDGEKFINERHKAISNDKIPQIGMKFESEEAAYKFYNEYAKIVGFSIRKQVAHKDPYGVILDRVFCCSCQGQRRQDKRDATIRSHRPETRKGCLAMMKINARQTGKYTIEKFIAAHNGHGLASPNKSHMLRSHRIMSVEQANQANDIYSSGITPKAGFELMAKQMGGRENVGFIFDDYKNYLRSKRTVEMKKGDTGGVLEYLQQRQLEDPNFFYAIQVDQDDLIANIFWADSQMMADFAHFGDVVCFDTTYRKCRDGRPFALFVGVNHHKQTSIFGAALLYDETADTFMWLFDTFARAMSGKKPQTILTDQDAAMAKALAQTWPETYHRLCIWHIYQNAAIHLSSVFSSFKDFSKDFSSCIYDYEEEDEFMSAWEIMLEKYGLQTNEWLERMFNIRKKWALVYGRQTFCADMTTTQRSESMNSVLKRYVSYKNNMLQFFQHFQRLIDDRRYEEMREDLRNSQSTPELPFRVEILKHAVSVYTHEVFRKFQIEVSKAYDSTLELCSETGDLSKYKITPYRKHHQKIVTYNSSTCEVSCSCRKFEFAGILCSHALKVLSFRKVVRIAEIHIKKRWTKKAKKGLGQPFRPHDTLVPMNETDEKKMIGVRYRDLSRLHNQLVTRAALALETYEIARDGILKIIEEVDIGLEKRSILGSNLAPKSTVKEILVSRVLGKETPPTGVVEKHNVGSSRSMNNVADNSTTTDDNVKVRGWKVKEKKNVKSGKRPKSGLEQATRKKKQKNNNVSSSNNSFILHNMNERGSQMQDFRNGANSVNFGAFEPSTFHSSSQLPFLSQPSQGDRIGMSSLSMYYDTQGHPISHIRPFHAAQHNVSPFYAKPDQHANSSLTQLLQEQLFPRK